VISTVSKPKYLSKENQSSLRLSFKEGLLKQTLKKKDSILGVATLTTLDMAAIKLMANSGRGLDMDVHCRDVIDLAMLNLTKTEFAEAITKAKVAYGEAILKDLSKVIDRLGEANGLLERCMKTMDVSVPRALLWQNISKVKSFIADGMPK
jgi:hypothetical protein